MPDMVSLVNKALGLVGVRIFGKDWIGLLSDREFWLLARYVSRRTGTPITNSDGVTALHWEDIVPPRILFDLTLAAEIERAFDHYLHMQHQYECATDWLKKRGVNCYPIETFNSEACDRVLTQEALVLPSRAEPFKSPTDAMIHREITAVYDSAQNAPPNIKQLPKVVRPRLQGKGYDASEAWIMRLGSDPQHVSRRRRPGRTISSEQRARQR